MTAMIETRHTDDDRTTVRQVVGGFAPFAIFVDGGPVYIVDRLGPALHPLTAGMILSGGGGFTPEDHDYIDANLPGRETASDALLNTVLGYRA